MSERPEPSKATRPAGRLAGTSATFTGPRTVSPRNGDRVRAAHVEDALREALAHTGGPVVVDAVVDPYAISVPSHVPFHVAAGFSLGLWRQMMSGHPGLPVREIKNDLGLASEVEILS